MWAKSYFLSPAFGSSAERQAELSPVSRFFLQAAHELGGVVAGGAAVSDEFDGIHAPLAALAARHEERAFLHLLRDLALVDARVLAGLTQEPQEDLVFARVDGLGYGGSPPLRQHGARAA